MTAQDFAQLTLSQFATMTGPELVNAYNFMISEARERGNEAYRDVNRFASTEAGAKRCDMLASTLRALREGAKAEAGRKKNAQGTMAANADAAQQEGEDMATKKAKPEAGEERERLATGKIAELFEVRAGSNRDKMLAALIGKFSKPVTATELLEALYGVANKEDVGAMRMVMKGIETIINAKGLPYKIVKGKVESDEPGHKEMTFALAADR